MTAVGTTNLRYGAKASYGWLCGLVASKLRRGCRTALPRSGRQEMAFLFRLLLEWISFIASFCGNVIGQKRILKQLDFPHVAFK